MTDDEQLGAAMRSWTVLLVALTIMGLVGCSPGGAAPTASVSASQSPSPAVSIGSPSVAPTERPTPDAPALGSWTAGCASPDADAAALVANLMAQSAFRSKVTPSAEPGWSDALAAAVKPLDACQTAHLLAVAKAVTFGDDTQAKQTASARIIALAKGRTLVLSGTQVGRITLGTSEAAATPVLTAIMGTPQTTTQTCEVSGQTWNVLEWGDFHVSFIKTGKGAVLDTWSITPKGGTAANLKLADNLPLRATFAQLKAFKAGLVQEDVFGTGAGPWIAEVRPNLRYDWVAKTGLSFRVEGGPLRPCE